MISDGDFWAAALLMVKRYKDNAGARNALASDGDNDGCVVWVQIARAIERLQATKPAEGEKVQ